SAAPTSTPSMRARRRSAAPASQPSATATPPTGVPVVERSAPFVPRSFRGSSSPRIRERVGDAPRQSLPRALSGQPSPPIHFGAAKGRRYPTLGERRPYGADSALLLCCVKITRLRSPAPRDLLYPGAPRSSTTSWLSC